MATTIAAQIAVSPILLATFGGLSVTAVAANVAVLWSVPIAMLASALTAGIGIGSPIAATPVAWIAHGVLSYQIAVIHFFSGVETILHP